MRHLLSEYRKSVLPKYNMAPGIITLDGFVDKIRELDPEKNDIDYKHGYRYMATVSYPHSLGEMGNHTDFYYKERPTVENIKKDILQEYKDFKKDMAETIAKSGRDENIEKAINKALVAYRKTRKHLR